MNNFGYQIVGMSYGKVMVVGFAAFLEDVEAKRKLAEQYAASVQVFEL